MAFRAIPFGDGYVCESDGRYLQVDVEKIRPEGPGFDPANHGGKWVQSMAEATTFESSMLAEVAYEIMTSKLSANSLRAANAAAHLLATTVLKSLGLGDNVRPIIPGTEVPGYVQELVKMVPELPVVTDTTEIHEIAKKFSQERRAELAASGQESAYYKFDKIPGQLVILLLTDEAHDTCAGGIGSRLQKSCPDCNSIDCYKVLNDDSEYRKVEAEARRVYNHTVEGIEVLLAQLASVGFDLASDRWQAGVYLAISVANTRYETTIAPYKPQEKPSIVPDSNGKHHLN